VTVKDKTIERIGSRNAGSGDPGGETSGARPERPCLYVHLNSGEIVEVNPATRVSLTHERMVLLNDEEQVATFSRSDVYYTCGLQTSPPFLS
jgi:hypothetical protein